MKRGHKSKIAAKIAFGGTITLAVKIDIDTLKGYLEGLPRLLDILKAHDVRASVFFSMGPDNSGKAIRRIFRKGFISKMFRTKAPSAYGIKTLLYGTLLPAPMITAANPDLIRRTVDEGHDCGIHSWDHVYWQDNLPSLSREQIRAELERAFSQFEEYAHFRPDSCAAPGWQVTQDSLIVQDKLGLKYCSDTRGYSPFIPEMGDITFSTPQIPSTLPTLDEVLGDVRPENVSSYYAGLLRDGLNVHTIHTEMEGGMMHGAFSDFLDKCRDMGVRFLTLKEAVKKISAFPKCRVVMGEIPGRAGNVALQEEKL
ncbi:MAG: 4-deoxy-4-formamido-L-arabinose-phosphoundecaprenol deformylase [Synergistaceae bacterium]|nr:4-deoxy-4-formamido-L-arabinose-phosphoundecaprenol deformylase [Synergistaceae bacterium]